MDVDAVLARQPEVALVDELAHTNVPGFAQREALAGRRGAARRRHRRHLDGQHPAPRVGERRRRAHHRRAAARDVPDEVVRRADQIELVDMTPEALRRRMAHGNIYTPEKVDAALAQLLPPRQPRRAARARAALGRRQGRREPPAVHGGPRHHRPVGDARAGRRRAHRRARRRGPHPARGAHGARAPRASCSACTSAPATGSPAPPPGSLERHRALLEELGGSYHEVVGADVAGARRVRPGRERDPARARREPPVAVEPRAARARSINRVIRESGDIDVHVISTRSEGEVPSRTARPRRVLARASPASGRARRPCSRSSRSRCSPCVLTHVRDHVSLGSDLLLYLAARRRSSRRSAARGSRAPRPSPRSCSSTGIFTPPIHTFTISDGAERARARRVPRRGRGGERARRPRPPARHRGRTRRAEAGVAGPARGRACSPRTTRCRASCSSS